MSITEDFWHRSQSVQSNFLKLASYNTAFLSNAAVQTMHLALTGPLTFWSTVARAGSEPAEVVAAVQGASVEILQDHIDAQTAAAEEISETVSEVVEANVGAATELSEAVVEAVSSPMLLDAPRDGVGDDLTVLSGIGPKLASALNEFGIFHFDQIAGLNAEGIAWLNDNQKGFAMTAERYDIVGQAKAKLEK